MSSWYNKIIVPRLLNSAMGSSEFEKIRRVVVAEASGIVLEIGLGPGYNFPFYKNISKLYALEPSRELTEIAKTRTNSLSFPVDFLKARAENIPLPDQSVDTVVSTWTMCSVHDPRKVLEEIKRVLKTGGKFVFVDHGASPNKITRTVQKVLTPITKPFTGNCHYDRPIEKLIEEAGFQIEKMEHPQERSRPLVYNYQGVARVK